MLAIKLLNHYGTNTMSFFKQDVYVGYRLLTYNLLYSFSTLYFPFCMTLMVTSGDESYQMVTFHCKSQSHFCWEWMWWKQMVFFCSSKSLGNNSVYQGFRHNLGKWLFFGSLKTTFKVSNIFRGDWGSSKNCLVPPNQVKLVQIYDTHGSHYHKSEFI